MVAKSFQRGHPIFWNNKEWLYEDNYQPITIQRPCVRCHRIPTVEGHDSCLGYLPGITNACCGHGVEQPYNE